MNEETIRNNIAKNLVAYRKKCNLTQLQLAEKLAYSDKAVSKWERGDTTPDVFVLYKLAELYGITLNDFLLDKVKLKTPYFFKRRVLIAILSSIVVWLVAVASYVLGSYISKNAPLWVIFIYAVCINFIVLTVFASLWANRFNRLIAISGLIWTSCLSIFISLFLFTSLDNAWLIFLIGIPIQAAFIFFFMMKKKNKNS